MIGGDNLPRPNHVLCTHSKPATKEPYCLDSADFKVRPQLNNQSPCTSGCVHVWLLQKCVTICYQWTIYEYHLL